MLEQKASLPQVLARLANFRDDVEAWKILYLKMWPFVMGLNYRFLGGARELAEDASQEVFLRLLQYAHFESLQDPNNFRSYVRTMCLNVSKDQMRQSLKRKESQLIGDEVNPPRVSLPRFHDVEIRETYEQLLSRLSRGDRELIELAALGYTLDEIARATGLTYGNVAVRIHRLRKKL